MPPRRLLLVRHAKAADGPVDAEQAADRAGRPAGRGDRGVARSRPGWCPTAWSSPRARRAAQTWEGAAEPLDDGPQLIVDERIYDNTVEALLAVIRETPGDVQTLAVVGHNPSIGELTHDARRRRGQRGRPARPRGRVPDRLRRRLRADDAVRRARAPGRSDAQRLRRSPRVLLEEFDDRVGWVRRRRAAGEVHQRRPARRDRRRTAPATAEHCNAAGREPGLEVPPGRRSSPSPSSRAAASSPIDGLWPTTARVAYVVGASRRWTREQRLDGVVVDPLVHGRLRVASSGAPAALPGLRRPTRGRDDHAVGHAARPARATPRSRRPADCPARSAVAPRRPRRGRPWRGGRARVAAASAESPPGALFPEPTG